MRLGRRHSPLTESGTARPPANPIITQAVRLGLHFFFVAADMLKILPKHCCKLGYGDAKPLLLQEARQRTKRLGPEYRARLVCWIS